MKPKLLYLKDKILKLYTNGNNLESISKQLNCYPQAVASVLKHIGEYKSYRPNQGNTRYFVFNLTVKILMV